MKICVNFGHALTGKGTGAVGILNESKENRNVGNELVKLLRENSDHTVIIADFNGTDNYVKATNYANSQKADLFISIHFNSGANDKNGNGKSCGTETLVYSANQDNTIAKRINSNIVRLGFRDRRKSQGGILVRNDLYVLKNTKMKALLVECCFVDDRDDVNLYNYKTMAKAIAEGILGKSISTSNQSSSKLKDGDYSGRKAKVVKVAANDTLNVRYSRDANAKKIGELKPGQLVTCEYNSKGWMSIRGYSGDKGLGYVNSYYLELV